MSINIAIIMPSVSSLGTSKTLQEWFLLIFTHEYTKLPLCAIHTAMHVCVVAVKIMMPLIVVLGVIQIPLELPIPAQGGNNPFIIIKESVVCSIDCC